VLYRDGVPVATWVAERFEPLQELSAADSALARQRLTETATSGTRDAIAEMLASLR
jgi:ATP-dependent Lhr-like helicase